MKKKFLKILIYINILNVFMSIYININKHKINLK